MSNIPAKIKQIVHEELRGVYTVSLCVVEEFDPASMQVRVSLKRDKDVVLGEIPVASVFAQSDGAGLVPPLAADDEGLLLHTKEPIDELTVESGHQAFELGHVAFDLNDALFFPRYWNDNDTKPVDVVSTFKPGDFLIAHSAATTIHIKGDGHTDPGTLVIEDTNGQTWTMDADGTETRFEHPTGPTLTVASDEITVEAANVTLGSLADAVSLAIQEHDHDVTLADGSTTTTSTPNQDGTDTKAS